VITSIDLVVLSPLTAHSRFDEFDCHQSLYSQWMVLDKVAGLPKSSINQLNWTCHEYELFVLGRSRTAIGNAHTIHQHESCLRDNAATGPHLRKSFGHCKNGRQKTRHPKPLSSGSPSPLLLRTHVNTEYSVRPVVLRLIMAKHMCRVCDSSALRAT